MQRIAWALLLGAALSAQNPTATLVGTVTDPTGLAILAADVEVRNSGTNEIRKMETDHRGEFTAPNLPPGIYDVSITHPGFRTLHETGLELQVEQQAHMEFQLQLGSLADKVEVTASVPLINTGNGQKGDVMVAAEIAEMPLDGRDFTNLGLLTPGAVTGNPQGGYGSFASVSGARSDNSNLLVDGNNNRSAITGGAVSRPNLDAIQEFKMETSGYSAETGRFAGGVNVVLKSGGNRVHGALFEFLRNDKLNARNLHLLLRGWQLSGTSIAHTGPPFTPTNSNANTTLGEATRPNRIGKGSVPNPSPTHWFNVADFPVVPTGSYVFGNAGRDIIDGPGQVAINLSFSRNFAIREGSNLQFRWETFNVLNHANFPLPVATVNTANAGTIQSAADPRTMQAALRLTF